MNKDFWTKGRIKDKELILYFLPSILKNIKIVEEDWIMFFKQSERGIRPIEITEGYKAILEGKRWRGIQLQMWEEGTLDRGGPHRAILGGYSPKEIPPRDVVDFIKKEQCKKGREKGSQGKFNSPWSLRIDLICEAEVPLYNRMFNVQNPVSGETDSIAHLNSHSIKILRHGKLGTGPNITQPENLFQFERFRS